MANTLEKPEVIGVQALHERGWTPALIKRFLGDADKLSRNPYYRSAAPVRYYDLSRVATAELLPEFADAKLVASRRSTASRASVDKRRAELIDHVRRMAVTVRKLPFDKLLHDSLEHWRQGEREWEEYPRDGSDAPLEARQRWAVNYARHCLTKYDRALEDVAGKIGVNEAVVEIRAKVYAAIAAAWPCLADECLRQEERRREAQS